MENLERSRSRRVRTFFFEIYAMSDIKPVFARSYCADVLSFTSNWSATAAGSYIIYVDMR